MKANEQTVRFGGREWKVFPFAHTPNTYLEGFSLPEDFDHCAEDWKVLNLIYGELWMNNYRGYMYIINRGENKTYVSLF